MPASPDELIPTRRSLLSRLKDWDDQESWREFFNTYWKLIYGVALRAGLSDAEAQDVVQDTVVAVARKMQDFRYDPAAGSFKNWLLVITRRRIADHQRKQYRQPLLADCGASTGTETDGLERIPAPVDPGIDAIWDAEWEKNLLDAAIERVRLQIDPRQFQIFDCYVLKEWPVKDVTRTLGVSATQVYLARHRISRLIKKEARSLERKIIAGLTGPGR
ncbi:MAG TPA: sigma-70 family RNA polymerase sigma factor [Candidatus Saccharimonadales bacterium]|nr:sigma-70 family RNA polymerase sigma factor [Candidatus Saccharimonadales bacterium]